MLSTVSNPAITCANGANLESRFWLSFVLINNSVERVLLFSAAAKETVHMTLLWSTGSSGIVLLIHLAVSVGLAAIPAVWYGEAGESMGTRDER